MDSQLAVARECVRQFVDFHPELRLSEEVPIQSVTNRVLYGERAGDRIVFKVFAQTARKWQEERALQRLAASGVVPRLYPYPSEEILVMARFPGRPLWQEQEGLPAAAVAGMYRQVGAGLARLVKAAVSRGEAGDWRNPYAPDDRFWSTRFDEYYDVTLANCRDALMRHAIDRPALHDSVRELQAARSEVLDWPVFMHVDDIHGGNMLSDGGKFQGFIDFEMSRLGNEIYLLGATLQWACLEHTVQWAPMRAGYEEERGAPLSANTMALVELFAPFQCWCRFAWYWGSDEQPDWVWRGDERDAVLTDLVHTLDVAQSVAGAQL